MSDLQRFASSLDLPGSGGFWSWESLLDACAELYWQRRKTAETQEKSGRRVADGAPISEGYLCCSKGRERPAAPTVNRPLGATAVPRLDRDEVTPYG